ncbi:cupin domain-containing protein [Marinomonas spartinae]|uniref:cupin domain-containing protein n=1 Tax=Marinomonas spartinae TaxID=1792290 RepID=UPI0018F1C6E9|nr:cupin domain-containing protein [Marinomonas spartinae]MBJ7556869.1 cupin domain-containing protein [Marinomonas spartinae]
MSSLLKTIEQNPVELPRESRVLPERLIEGNPLLKTWVADLSRDGEVNTGIWQATPGTSRSLKGDSFEFCYLLEGVVELTPEGGDPVIYKAGDCFVLKPGYKGVWRTIETVKKIYVSVG